MPNNPMSMRGSTILVTGASSGIGRDTAVLLSEMGARVVVSGRNSDRLAETLGRLQGSDHRAEPFDLMNADEIPAWIRRITSEIGPLNGLVHSAGLQQTLPIRALTMAKIENLMRANFTSAVMLLKGMRQKGSCMRGSGAVLISSVSGLAGRAAVPIYSASKAALIGFCRSAAVELAPEEIRVNCVAPGYVATEMWSEVGDLLTPEQMEAMRRAHPLGIGNPRDVSNAVLFLLSPCSRWITGTTLTVDGGYTAQ